MPARQTSASAPEAAVVPPWRRLRGALGPAGRKTELPSGNLTARGVPRIILSPSNGSDHSVRSCPWTLRETSGAAVGSDTPMVPRRLERTQRKRVAQAFRSDVGVFRKGTPAPGCSARFGRGTVLLVVDDVDCADEQRVAPMDEMAPLSAGVICDSRYVRARAAPPAPRARSWPDRYISDEASSPEQMVRRTAVCPHPSTPHEDVLTSLRDVVVGLSSPSILFGFSEGRTICRSDATVCIVRRDGTSAVICNDPEDRVTSIVRLLDGSRCVSADERGGPRAVSCAADAPGCGGKDRRAAGRGPVVQEGGARVTGRRWILLLVVPAVAVACMPTGSDARRAAYLDCARDQGLTVVDGTIRTTSGAELARLDACEAIPR